MSIEKRSKNTGDIRRINLHVPGGRDELESLRQTLVSQGDLVSPAGRQRTIDVFGEPLSPRQVVEKICEDVKREGLSAVLDYTKRIDHANVTEETFRVPLQTLEKAHQSVAPEFLAVAQRQNLALVTLPGPPPVLEGDGEVKLVADVVAGFTRGPRHALALDDEVVIDHAPLLAGHALDLLPGHGKVEAGVGGDSHRGLLEFLLLSDRVTAVRRLGGHKLLRDVAPASGPVSYTHLTLPTILLV